EGRPSGRTKTAGEASPLQGRRDMLGVLDEPVVEREEAGVVRKPAAQHIGTPDDGVLPRETIELPLELTDRPRRHGRAVADVVVHDDREHAQSFSSTATNDEAVARPAGESSRGRWNESASRL